METMPSPSGPQHDPLTRRRALLDGFDRAVRDADAQADGGMGGDYYLQLARVPGSRAPARWWFERHGAEMLRPFADEHIAVLRMPSGRVAAVREGLERLATSPAERGQLDAIAGIQSVDPARKLHPALLVGEAGEAAPCMAVLYSRSTQEMKAAVAERIARDFRATARGAVEIYHFANGVTVVSGQLTKVEMVDLSGRYGMIRSIDPNPDVTL